MLPNRSFLEGFASHQGFNLLKAQNALGKINITNERDY